MIMVQTHDPAQPGGETGAEARLRALLAATAQGDRRAFQRLYTLTYPSVFAFAMRLLSRHDRAEEVANDTMVTVWRSAERFEGRSKVTTWMFGIAYRTAMNTLRKDRAERRHVELDEAGGLEDTFSPDAAALIDSEAVSRALAALPGEMRAIMVMTYQYGFSIAEIAKVTDCPSGTIKTRMAAARRSMRAHLTKDMAE